MTAVVANVCRSFVFVAALPLFLAAAARADEVTDWHEHMLAELGSAGTNAVLSTREAALVSAAIFDAVNGIDRRFEPIHVDADAPRGASKRAAAVQAAYAVLVARFPSHAADLNAKRTASLAAIDATGQSKSLQRGVEWGQDVAEAILAWRSTDGITPTPAAYTGGLELGRWRPTPTAFASGVLPQFAYMAPWAILSPSQFLPAGPPALNSARYATDFNETKTMGSAGSLLRTADQTDACRFWAGTSATYLFNRLAIDLLEAEDSNLCKNAHLLASMNVAMADSIICCWNAKYFYEFWRPVTAIPLADTDGNDATEKETGWTPLITTPAHPEYPSGHSAGSGAACAVLSAYFGDDTAFTLETQTDPNWKRSFTSFTDATDEVADARIFAGIHFRSACEDSLAIGAQVAEYLAEHSMRRVHGNDY